MKRRPRTAWFGTLFVLLALMSLLSAPMAVAGHADQSSTPATASDQHHTGCDDHGSQPADDDCCSTSACSCACHAPLTSTVMFPPTPLFSFEPFREVTHRLPVVYLTIFVPPQNRS